MSDCKNCKHLVMYDYKNKSYSCESRECEFEPEEQEPTTKNDLAQERYQDLIDYFGDEKVAKTILEDKKEFKAWLERHRWYVKKADELARELEQIKGTTKNDLGVDCISRDAVKYYIQAHIHEIITESSIDKNAHTNRVLRALLNGVDTMPSVTPQEPILNKIRAEIEKLQKMCDKNDLNLMAQYSAFGMVLDILDKYKADRSVEE